MAKYDMRAAGEIDMAKERWIENPEPLVKSILAIIKTSKEGAHRKDYNETIKIAKTAAEELVKEVEIRHGKIKSKIVKRLVRIIRNVMPIREHPKYFLMKLILIYKKAFLEEARILVNKGYLDTQCD